MSRLALALQKRARVDVSRPAVALALVILLISAPQIAAAGAPASGKAAGTLSVGDISIEEGNTQVFVPVTFTGDAPPFEFTITAFTGPGDTATDGADYTGRTTTLTGTGLPQTKIFNIEIHDDTEVEGNETFTVKITGVGGAGAADVTIGDDTATVTITPDDDAGGGGGGNATVSINDVTAVEGDSGSKNFSFTVTLSAASDAFTVQAATADGSATAGSDYTAKTSTLSFNGTGGETKTFNVSVNGDATAESDETFTVNLSNVFPSGGSGSIGLPTIGDGQGVGTITDDDDGGGGGGGGGTVTIVSPESKSAGFPCSGGVGEIGLAMTGTPDLTVVASAPWIELRDSSVNVDVVIGSELNSGTLRFRVKPNASDTVVTGQITIGSTKLQLNGHDRFDERIGEYFELVQPFQHHVPAGGINVYSFALKPEERQPSGMTYFGVTDEVLPLCWGLSRQRGFRAEPAGAPVAVGGIARAQANVRPSMAATSLPRGFGDFNGDGLEEIVVLAPEYDGAARGAWVQAYNTKGKRLMNFFPGKQFPTMRLLAMDTDGNERAEPVFLGWTQSGSTELQLRNNKGALQDRKPASPAGSEWARLLHVEYDGKRGEEIAIAYQAKNGTGRFAVWGLNGKKLKRLGKELSIIGAKSALHQWLPLDIDDDGLDEIVATYTAPNGKGATMRVVDPRTGETLVNKTVLKTGFEEALWTLGDFDPDRSGAELLVGYRKKNNGFFKVLAGDGTVLSTSKSISAKPLHAWGPIQSKPAPRGTVRDLVFVGFTRPNGDAAFEVWDPSTKKAKRVGGGTVASDEYEVLGWKVGDFDGDADNGGEIVVITRHLGDRNVGFQMFGRDGKERGQRVQVFDSNYIHVSASAIVFARKGRLDLAFGARTVGGQPEVRVWNVNGAVLLKKIAVLSKDVE